MQRLTNLVIYITICISLSFSHQSKADPENWGPFGLAVDNNNYRILTVQPGSPADGLLKPGDTLQGWFSSDSLFGSSFDALEGAPNGGSKTFSLTDGREVTLTLPHFPNWGPESPRNCPKCLKMIADTTNFIISNNYNGRLGTWLPHLALLSTGEPAHLEHVRKFLHSAAFAKPDYNQLKEKNNYTWLVSYSTILLTEYYLITNDPYVLPAIRNHALAMAYGASGGGHWNHWLYPYGKYLDNPNTTHIKRQRGYLHQNSASLACYIGLLLAEKCGVREPIVLEVLEKNLAYYRSLIGEITVPYSAHHDSERNLIAKNGTAAMASIALSLAGDTESAKYFIPNSVYNYYEMYYDGHTGPFFGRLWIGLGANLGGHAASKYVFDRTKLLLNACRKSNGDFGYEGWNNLAYGGGMSPAGAHLLNLCRDRRKLFITGKGSSELLRWDHKTFNEQFFPSEQLNQLDTIEWVLGASKRLRPSDRLISLVKGENLIRFGRSFFASNDRFNEILNRIKEGNIWEKENAFDFFQKWGAVSSQLSNLSQTQENELFSLMRSIINDNNRTIHDRNSAALVLMKNVPSDSDLLLIINFFITKQQDDFGFEKVRLVEALKENNHITQDNRISQQGGLFASRQNLLILFTNSLLKHPNDKARKLGMIMLKQIPRNQLFRTAAAIEEVARDKNQEYHTYYGTHRAVSGLGDNSALFNHLAAEGITFSENPASGTLSFDDAVWQSMIQNGNTSYDDWIAARFVDPTHSNAQKTSDPDKDGQTNFIEYALGSNPHTLTSTPLNISSVNNNQVELSFEIPMGNSDAIITPQSSGNIANWQSHSAAATPQPNGIKQTIRWSVPQSQAEFFRLLVKPK